MLEQPVQPTGFKRSLGLLDGTMLVAGSMIGSGIFILSAPMAREVGSGGYLLALWVVAGIITLIAALSYGELAGMMPQAGGQYVYINRAFGKLPSFLYGWTVFTVIQTGVMAAVAVAFASYSAVFWPVLDDPLLSIGDFKVKYGQLLAIAVIVTLTFINSRGVTNAKIVQLLFTSTKLLALLVLIVVGLAVGLQTDVLSLNFQDMWNAERITGENVQGTTIWSDPQALTGLALVGVLAATLIPPLFASDAWNNVTFIAGEMKRPEKNIPRSLLLGTLIVTVLYVLSNVAYLSLLPLHGDPNAADVAGRGIQFAEENRVGAAAASMIFGDQALFLMAGLIMISTFGCINGIALAGPRLYYAMAKEKMFFRKAGELNKSAVPGFGLWMQCLWASALCLSGTYQDLVAYSTFASMLFYIVTITGLFVLRRKEPNAPRPYKAFGYPVVPALYILVAVAICAALVKYDWRNTYLALGWIALGVPLYLVAVRKRNPV